MKNLNGNSGPDSSVPEVKQFIEPAERPTVATKRRMLATGLVTLLLAVGIAACGDLPETEESASETDTSQTKEDSTVDTTSSESTEETQEQETDKEPAMTPGQSNAVRAAENYLSVMPFSRQGLIEQLSSEYGDGYSVEDATFAVDYITVDWNEQAAKAAENYLDLMPFSKSGLIEQLVSEHGDGYTQEQAEYGVKKAGL